MESQNEMHQGARTPEDKSQTGTNDTTGTSATQLETPQQRPQPFSEFDPFRATRIDEVASETKDLFDSLSLRGNGFENLDENQLRTLREDALRS